MHSYFLLMRTGILLLICVCLSNDWAIKLFCFVVPRIDTRPTLYLRNSCMGSRPMDNVGSWNDIF